MASCPINQPEKTTEPKSNYEAICFVLQDSKYKYTPHNTHLQKHFRMVDTLRRQMNENMMNNVRFVGENRHTLTDFRVYVSLPSVQQVSPH